MNDEVRMVKTTFLCNRKYRFMITYVNSADHKINRLIHLQSSFTFQRANFDNSSETCMCFRDFAGILFWFCWKRRLRIKSCRKILFAAKQTRFLMENLSGSAMKIHQILRQGYRLVLTGGTQSGSTFEKEIFEII